MQKSLVWKRGVLLAFIIVIGVSVWADIIFSTSNHSQYFEAHFLDVGQGDATFFETPEGVQVLIDGGKDASVLRTLASEMGFSIELSIW